MFYLNSSHVILQGDSILLYEPLTKMYIFRYGWKLEMMVQLLTQFSALGTNAPHVYNALFLSSLERKILCYILDQIS